MTFLTFSFLIASVAAAAVPIALHLLMRGRPKKVVFPTFAFLHRRVQATRRTLTLKRILLLLMRCAVVILIGLALARPSFQSSDTSSAGPVSRDGPVAAALVIDTSVRSGIIAENRTRLDRAREIASRLITGLPAGSQAAIFDSNAEFDSFQVDLLAAAESLERLRPGVSIRPQVASVAAAVRLLSEADEPNRELFVLTDRSAASWNESFRKELHRTIDEANRRLEPDESPIAFYLIDVSTPWAQNGGITSCTVAFAPNESGTLRIDLDVTHTGGAQDATLEFWLLDAADAIPNSRSVSSATVGETVSETPGETPSETAEKAAGTLGETSSEAAAATSADGEVSPKIMAKAKTIISAPITFEASDTAVNQRITLYPTMPPNDFALGFVRLVPDDAFSADNLRWFAIRRFGAPKILLASAEPVAEKTLFMREALAPETLRQDGRAPFDTTTISLAALEQMTPEQMAEYRAILLLDSGKLNGAFHKKLADYAAAGGGVGLFYGKSGVPAQDDSDAAALLGGHLTEMVRRAGQGVVLVPSDSENPILAEFRPLLGAGAIPWGDLTVYRYWKFEPLDDLSEVTLRYSDGGAALVTRPLGDGTVTVATTPFSDAPNRPDAWNRLPVGESAWVFLMLADGIARSLVSGGGESLQLEPGATALLRPKLTPFPPSAVLELPDAERVTIPTEPNKRRIRFAGTRHVGPYRLLFDSSDAAVSASADGFCVNTPASDFDLTALEPDQLKAYWEPIPIQTVSNASEVVSGRFSRGVGRELFPIVVVLLGILLAAETAFSNRFYD